MCNVISLCRCRTDCVKQFNIESSDNDVASHIWSRLFWMSVSDENSVDTNRYATWLLSVPRGLSQVDLNDLGFPSSSSECLFASF